MDVLLIRGEYNSDGIFGSLIDDDGKEICLTLEHSYDAKEGNGSYKPKLPAGSYTCVLGQHELEHSKPFMTYEVMDVPGHTGILFHVGNFNKDSNGCILLGKSISTDDDGAPFITHSRDTFKKFMELQNNTKQFTLTVKDK